MPLIHTLIARVAPAYTERVQFTPEREFHKLVGDMRESDEIARRDAMRTMFINDSCQEELSHQWFNAACMGEWPHFVF